ncbi:MAG: hypothetical protein LBS49_04455 [Candidatus Accumulibacter sp.]|nr:hypothetical protein [Accumulibacter sp.]
MTGRFAPAKNAVFHLPLGHTDIQAMKRGGYPARKRAKKLFTIFSLGAHLAQALL